MKYDCIYQSKAGLINQTVTLYGKTSRTTFGYYTITADQIAFYAKELRGVARNAATVFNSDKNAQFGTSDSLHFDFQSKIIKSSA